jgi:ferritin-like metal-binding protein YciE
MELTSLQDLYVEQLKDLYSAETQLLKALPKMAEAASDAQLKQGFELHAQQTQVQIERLEQIFEELGEKSSGHTCAAMKGLIEEGNDVIKATGDPAVKDAALIAAAQRVEHYEIAATARCAPLPTIWARTSTPICCNKPSMKKAKPTRS